jgi:UDP-glucose 4-epimerase
MNVVITGSSGYIGKKFINSLGDGNITEVDLKIGRDVKSYYFHNDIEVIYHLAGQSGAVPSMEDPINDAEQNIMATLRMIGISNRTGARLIFPTSGGALEPESPYGLSKKTCEEYIKMLCKDYVILRLSSIYGEKPKGVVDSFIRDKKCIIYGDGSAERDFVHVDDIVHALFLARKWETGTYDCGRGFGTSIIDVARATGKDVYYKEGRAGEKHKVILQNTTPNWIPGIDVIKYIKEQCEKY